MSITCNFWKLCWSCHAIVVGDAELVWTELINDYENGNLKKIYEKNLDSGFFSTPVPRFDLIINKKIGDFLPVQAGRGCPNTCSFCSVSCLYKGHYVKELGFKKFLLLDDNIFSDRDYLHQSLKEIS